MADFPELHPSRGHHPVDNDSVTTGLNAETPTYPESGFLKCNKCGFTMNKHRHPKGWGDGIRIQLEYATWDNVNWDEFFWDGKSQTLPLVIAGCPLCGTYNYDGSFDDRKPKAYEKDLRRNK